MTHKKLYRDIEHSTIGGVASGLADFFNMDVTIFKVLFIITTLFGGGGLVLYVILWIVVPPKPLAVEYQAEIINDASNIPVEELDTETKKVKEKKKGALTGGLILILLGILFLINTFTDLSFNDIWPVVIICLGVIIVFSGFMNKKS